MARDNGRQMTFNRGLVFWGLALVTGGVVALAAQLGYLDRNALAGAWQLWPLVLVAIGLSILLARTGLALVGTIAAALVIGFAGGAFIAVGPGNVACGGSEPGQLTRAQGTFNAPADVDLKFDCGTLNVKTSEGSSWTVASESGEARPRIQSDASSLTVSSQPNQWWGAGRQHWIVTLPTGKSHGLQVEANAADTSLDLSGGRFGRLAIHPNAGSLRLDLGGARVDQLDFALNAGSTSIIVNSGSRLAGVLHVNAGSIELCTDGDVSMGLTVKQNITFSTNLDSSGLSRVGDTWTNSSRIGPHDIELTIEGNAGSFTLNPEGGCV
jgi:LiaI-LiaF-like transmembrane region